jgi:hypothetical protein
MAAGMQFGLKGKNREEMTKDKDKDQARKCCYIFSG